MLATLASIHKKGDFFIWIYMAEKMNNIFDPYGVLNIRVTKDDTVTEETMKKWRNENEPFAKYGSEMLHKYGFEELEKMDNEPKYMEGEPEEEEIMYSSFQGNTTSTAYLLIFLKKQGIALELVGDTDKLCLLANLIRDFREYSMKSVNYASFLYNYFKGQELCDWPGKNKILVKLKTNLPKGAKTRLKARGDFDGSWWSFEDPPSHERLEEDDPLFGHR